ncbi:MAG TPA: aspartate aminotransferase family protein [Gaiellaceae bacterium]|nr:aspartate aminotransferase family protein [Gaiellaceae bacterium]
MRDFSLHELLDERAGEGLALYERHANPRFVEILRILGFDRHWVRAEGPYLFDRSGTRYLDWLGGFGLYSVGRNNPTVRAALAELLELETASLPQLGLTDLPGLLAEALLAVAPASTDRVVFVNTGTEAVEAALKLGRAAAGRSRVVAVENGFHGLTLGSLSVNGGASERARYAPLLPGVSFVPFNDLEALEAELAREDVALFITEPVQGQGVILPQPGYLRGAQQLCRRYGTLFCLDEVQTGLGRTGRMFACEHWGLEPDLVTVAKALSGGYVPVGALLLRRSVHEAVFDTLEHATSHGSTFAPNDAAMVAGLATLHELAARDLPGRAARLGEYLLERTQPLRERFDVVKDVRGLGLAWAIEFGEPDGGSRTWRFIDGRQPALFSQFVIGPLFREHHILSQVAGHRINVLKGLPPLVLDESDVDWFAEALEDVLAKAKRLSRAALGFAARAAFRV